MQRIFILLVCLWVCPWLPITRATPSEDPAPKLLDRVIVMGASVSAGFGLSKELEVATPLSVLFDAALVDAPKPVLDLGENLLFLGPLYTGHYLLEQAQKAEPTLVIAVDYLFWYGMFWRFYDADSRLLGLEQGLAELDQLRCKLVIGDFPDVRPALKGRHEVTKGPVIFPSMIPDEPTRAAMNARVRAWAAERENVVLVPLSTFMEQLSSGEPIPLPHGQELKGTIPEILQVDLLHPRLAGCQALVLTILDAVQKADWGLGPNGVRWSMEDFRKAVEHKTEAKRQSARASAERRKERSGIR